MNLSLTRPIACVDLETTGVSITQDRIVEISIVKMFPDGQTETRTRRVNPTIPIPAEATAVHGISDEDVANEPTFKELANGIKQFLDNCDLCGFNSNKFDFPILTEEFLRAGIDVNFRNRHLVDVQQIFLKKNLEIFQQLTNITVIKNWKALTVQKQMPKQQWKSYLLKFSDIMI